MISISHRHDPVTFGIGMIEGVADALARSPIYRETADLLRQGIRCIRRGHQAADESDPADWPSWTDEDRWEPAEGFEPDEQDRAALSVIFPDDDPDDADYDAWIERQARAAAWSATFGCIISACNSPHNVERPA